MANKQTGGTKLTGINPLSYLGVEPSSPPQLVRFQREPTTRDFNFNLGDLWLVDSPFEVWMLVDKPQNVAAWVLIYPQGGGGGGISLIHTPAGDATALAGVIDFDDGENTNVEATGPHTIAYNLNRFISWPDTNASGTEGVIYLNNNTFMHAKGVTSAFLGKNAGNLANTGTANAGFGDSALNSLVTAVGNTGLGESALTTLTSGDSNTAVGSGALNSLVTGSENIAIGAEAGANLDATESFNIMIGNLGTSGDNNTIRLGSAGTHDLTYVAGVTNTTTASVTPETLVNVAADGQLGETLLTSTGATVEITSAVVAGKNTINLEVIGAGGNFSQPFNYTVTMNGSTGGFIFLGATVTLTQVIDVGNNVYPGDGFGAPAYFQAPETGIYQLFFVNNYNNPNSMQMNIVIGVNTYDVTQSLTSNNLINNILVPMTAGDQAKFSYNTLTAGTSNFVISGYRIA